MSLHLFAFETHWLFTNRYRDVKVAELSLEHCRIAVAVHRIELGYVVEHDTQALVPVLR